MDGSKNQRTTIAILFFSCMVLAGVERDVRFEFGYQDTPFYFIASR